jgi:hypothetical protein
MSFGNKPMQYAQPLGLQDQQLANNQMGSPIPYCAGTNPIAIQWITQIYGLKAFKVGGGKKGGGKGKGSGGLSTYNYFGTCAGVINSGPIDGILGIILNGESVWPAANGWSIGQSFNQGDTSTYDAQVWVCLAAHTSSNANAPGNAAFWTEHLFAASGYVSTAPAWTSGADYNVDALVNFGGSYTYICRIKNTASSGNEPGVSNGPGNTAYWKATTSAQKYPVWTAGSSYQVGQIVGGGVSNTGFYLRAYICVQANTASVASNYWEIYATAGAVSTDITVIIPNTGSTAKKNSLGSPTVYGVIRIYWGNQVAADPDLAGYESPQPAYVGLPYVVLMNWFLGQGNNTAPNLILLTRRTPAQTAVNGPQTVILDGQANPFAVASEILTSANTLGLPSALLDKTSFNATAQLSDNNTLLTRCSAIIDTQEPIASALARITDMSDAYFRYNPASGLIECGIYQHGISPPAGTYVTITQNELATDRMKLEGDGWSEVMSRCTLSYRDRVLTWASNTVKADDMRAFNVLGYVKNSNTDRPWCTRNQQALLLAAETLRTIGCPQLTADITVRREIGKSIRPGDYVFLDVDVEPNASTIQMFFRVKQKTTPMYGPIKFKLLADPTLSASVETSNVPAPVLGTLPTVQSIINARILFDDFDISGEDNAIIVLAERPDLGALGFEVFFDTDNSAGTFPSLGVATNWAAQGVLVNNVVNTDTSILIALNPDAVDTSLYGLEVDSTDPDDDTLLLICINEGATPDASTTSTTLTIAANGLVTLGIASTPGGLADGWEVVIEGDTVNPGINGKHLVTSFSAGFIVFTVPGLTITATTTDTSAIVKFYSAGTSGSAITNDSAGRGEVEVMSVTSMTLLNEYEYQIDVLRGRRNTTPQVFNEASTECWLIYRSDLAAFTSGLFPKFRTNLNASTTPNTAYFKLAPFTRSIEEQISNITSIAVTPPPKAPEGPDIVFTGGNTLNIAHGSFKTEINVTARDLNVGQIQLWLIPVGGIFDPDSTPSFYYNIATGANTDGGGYTPGNVSIGLPFCYIELNQTKSSFSIANGYLQDLPLAISSAGTYRLYCRAQDVEGLNSEVIAIQTIVAT